MSVTTPIIEFLSLSDLPELSPQSLQPFLKHGNGYAGGRGQKTPTGLPIPSFKTTPMRVPSKYAQVFLDLVILYRSLVSVGECDELMERIADIVYGWKDAEGRSWVIRQEEEAIEHECERQHQEELRRLESEGELEQKLETKVQQLEVQFKLLQEELQQLRKRVAALESLSATSVSAKSRRTRRSQQQ